MPEGGPEAEITDPETGAMPHLAAIAYTTCIVEVEVDTDTGVVKVVKEIHAYEVGRAINPLMRKEQINGGAAMGLGLALTEDVHPYWPSTDHAADGFESYVITTAADVPPESEFAILENPHPDGPFGAKEFSESSTNVPIPAIIAAIHDAVGVWITQFPATPEMVLRAREKKQ
ncbi:MAG: xanthine dehydrogenase family protein molybdopterin-binding subunit [Deltaproteobacteria bacterium]|jgi:nicotinate dehydrogenase medium molybdopterin subunit|nr:xanthine dehydrogenase family protein molybdopterin-binding subunit [Deltaproteobacteria bacterium]